MSQVFLTNWTIWFADDAPAASTGYKQLQWTGGGGPETNTNTTNEVYSEVGHYFSLPENNDADDTTPMRSITPRVFQIGTFDAGDLEPWFIDPDSVQHLTGGSIQTVNWTRVTGTGTNSGIVKVPYTVSGSQFVDSDIGRAIVNGTATGTLLWFDIPNLEAWIRPTDSTSTHDWDGPAGNILVTSGTGDVTQDGASVTGERLWTNANSIGTIAAETRIYVAQGDVEITNFWGNDHIDRLYLVNDGFDSGLIDKGLLTIYARQYAKNYDNFITDASAGGRSIAPIATGDSLSNDSGYRNVTVTGAGGVFVIDEIVTGGTTAARAVVLSNAGSPTTSFDYYLLDDLTDFNSSETLTGSIIGSNGSTSGAPTNTGPSTFTDITFDFGQIDETFNTGSGVDGGTEIITTDGSHDFQTENIIEYNREGGSEDVNLVEGTLYYANRLSGTTLSLHASAADAQSDTDRINLTSTGSETHLLKRTYDVDEDSVDESYSVIIDGATRPLKECFERMQFLLRRGETTQIFNSIEGQQYIGTDFRVVYDALTGTIDTGNTLTQVLTDGTTTTTIVQLHHTIDGFLMLRDTNGIFDTGGGAANLEIDGSNFVTMTGATTTEAIAPVKTSPFGTFQGGTFIGARGVLLENFDTLEANNVQFSPDEGGTKTPPLTVTFQLTGLQANSEVRLCDSDVPDGTPGQEIDGVENSGTTFSHQYIFGGNQNVHVIILHLDFKWQRIDGLVLGNTDQSIPIQQQTDRNYSNPS